MPFEALSAVTVIVLAVPAATGEEKPVTLKCVVVGGAPQ